MPCELELDAAMLPDNGDISRITMARATNRRVISGTRASVSIQSNLDWGDLYAVRKIVFSGGGTGI